MGPAGPSGRSGPELGILILGTGGGITKVYQNEPSSSFVFLADGKPILLCDVGFGVVCSCMTLLGSLPDNVYVSHNHGDHAGDLPVMLSVESERQHRMHVMSHPEVQRRLQKYRLHELRSTGKSVNDFAEWQACPEGCAAAVTSDLTLTPVRSRHAELCYGAVLAWKGKPVLGWSADSGYCEELYTTLSQADVLLLDARSKGTSEHASFDEVAAVARQVSAQGKRVYVTGYGRQSEAPREGLDPLLNLVHPGQYIRL